MKLHRELGIGQKAAWFILHRLRETRTMGTGWFSGPVEVEETYTGGKRANMSNAKRRELAAAEAGRGAVGKATVVGTKDRATRQVRDQVVERTDKSTLQGFVVNHAAPDSTVYTDEASACEGLPMTHDAVKHSVKEFVRGQIHTNGMESFWSMLKRGYIGTYHKTSPKHLNPYVTEFAGRHNIREHDTETQMGEIVEDMCGKRLRYRDLTKPNGLSSGARGA